MKRNIFYVSIVLIVIGIIGRVYADRYTHVTPEGMLVDSPWLLIGTLMILIGVLALMVLGILSAIGYLRNRLRR